MTNTELNAQLASYLGVTIQEEIDGNLYGYIKRPNCINVTGVVDFTKDANLLMQVFHCVTAPQLTYSEFLLSLTQNLALTIKEQSNEPT